jgi:NAD(P)-dependent dehydrogenase (short-subunit alcohol dehydrogenase family)
MSNHARDHGCARVTRRSSKDQRPPAERQRARRYILHATTAAHRRVPSFDLSRSINVPMQSFDATPKTRRPARRLDQRVALVTGAGRNLGRAIALAFAREGAHVLVNARTNRDEAEAVAAEARTYGVRALPYLADVSDEKQVQDMVRAAIDTFGAVDVLVNNAAVRPRQGFLEITSEDWERVLRTNLFSAYYACQAVLPGMVARRRGRILNISGADGFMGAANRAHNVASKAGIVGLTKGLAAEFGPAGITVNAVVPGLFDTTRDAAHYSNTVLTAWLEGLPIRRIGQPDELSEVCLFLASDEAAYITGQSLHVNGGGLMW